MRWTWPPCPMSLSPRPSWLHPLVAILSSGPAFPGKLLGRLPPTRLEGVLPEGGLRSREGAGEAWGQLCQLTAPAVCAAAIFIHRASSYIYPECHRSPKPSGQLPCNKKPRSGCPLYCQPSPGPRATSTALPSLCPTISTLVMPG